MNGLNLKSRDFGSLPTSILEGRPFMLCLYMIGSKGLIPLSWDIILDPSTVCWPKRSKICI